MSIWGSWRLFDSLDYLTKIKIAQIPLAIGSEIDSTYGDVIIVPGSGCNPGRGTEERLNLASSLYQIKKRKVILSEGTCFPHERARFVHRMIYEWKIDSIDILWDTLSMSTTENIGNSFTIAKEYGLSQAIICTSPFHQLRCWVVASKIWDGGFKVAQMEPHMLEMEKEQVYIDKRGKTIRLEYMKALHHLLFLW